MDAAQRTTVSFFASELRRARVAAGLSQDQLAQMISYSSSLVAMVETAQRTPSQDFTRRCDEALDTGGLLSRILEELVSHEIAPEWFRPWISIEREATSLRSYEPLLVQGLLQTPDYVRAVFRAGGSLSDEEVEQRVTARLERQELLSRGPLSQAVDGTHVGSGSDMDDLKWFKSSRSDTGGNSCVEVVFLDAGTT